MTSFNNSNIRELEHFLLPWVLELTDVDGNAIFNSADDKFRHQAE